MVVLLTDPQFLEPAEQASASITGPLAGIDPTRLSLLARFVHSKRIAKIEETMPVTCTLLGDSCSWGASFARKHPALDARHVVNALQFYRFLLQTWRGSPPTHRLLPDIAYCEIALAMLTLRPPPSPSGTDARTMIRAKCHLWARRTPGVRLRVAASEVRKLLTGEMPAPADMGRPAYLAMARSRRTGRPGIFALERNAFDFVEGLRQWHYLGPAENFQAGLDALMVLESHGIVDLEPRSPDLVD